VFGNHCAGFCADPCTSVAHLTGHSAARVLRPALALASRGVAAQDGAPQRLAIVEMKRGFNLDLLLQAVERMRTADEVWLAVPATSRGRDRDPRVRHLCRLGPEPG
jgi:hypothetical protein